MADSDTSVPYCQCVACNAAGVPSEAALSSGSSSTPDSGETGKTLQKIAVVASKTLEDERVLPESEAFLLCRDALVVVLKLADTEFSNNQ